MINGVPRILIIRLTAIGDVVRVLPTLSSLRNSFPHAQIDWAVERKAAAVVEGHPALDRVLVFERSRGIRGFWQFCALVRRSRYDVVLDFHGILKSGLIAGVSGAPDRYGFSRPRGQEMSSLFANHRMRLPSADLNRVEENLILCGALCPRSESLETAIFVPPEIQDEINEFFEETFAGGKQIVAVHAPVERPEKQWPLEHFAALSDLLLADGRFEVLLTWGPGQLACVENVLRLSRRNPIVAPETTDLKQLAWLLHLADAFFGGDTGPMHIAAAMGTPVGVVFGGTSPAKHAPYRRPCEVLYCADPGLSDAERLRRITPEMAYEACVRLLTKDRED